MKETEQKAKPVARKQGLVIQEMPDEILVYDLDRDRAHCLNRTAAFVWQRCDGRATTASIARALAREFGCAADEQIVWAALEQLGRNHLMQTQTTLPAAMQGMNRRALVRALGLAALVAAPVVTSIVAPTPAHAASGCVAAGQPCTAGGTPCCGVGVCSGGNCT
jgi:Coenzyme PQQ synthesis protein D (PqqD)